jgi:hypothetical protein
MALAPRLSSITTPARYAIQVALAFSLLSSCSDSSTPTPSIIDTWALLSFTDHGVVGVTTGTVTFRPDSTFEVVGTVTYPGEPTDSLGLAGTYTVQGTRLTLTAGTGAGDWDMLWTGQQFILTLRGPLPTNRLTLGRLP